MIIIIVIKKRKVEKSLTKKLMELVFIDVDE